MRRRFRSFDWRFHEDPSFSEMTALEQIAALRLWGASDDEGRQRGDDDSLMMNAFPRMREPREQILAAVERLVDLDEVFVYQKDGGTFLQMLGWKDRRSWQCAAYFDGSVVKSDFPPPPRGTVTVNKRKPGRPANSSVPRARKIGNKPGVSQDQNCASPKPSALVVSPKAEGKDLPPKPPLSGGGSDAAPPPPAVALIPGEGPLSAAHRRRGLEPLKVRR